MILRFELQYLLKDWSDFGEFFANQGKFHFFSDLKKMKNSIKILALKGYPKWDILHKIDKILLVSKKVYFCC